ncbi:hypothetical protein AA0616_0572 [Komagataeibacter nataicola NRIC 0616]|nr:hypothetical protein AA0616_0572 [Komagataeibacter nataicola NRIC 0616]
MENCTLGKDLLFLIKFVHGGGWRPGALLTIHDPDIQLLYVQLFNDLCVGKNQNVTYKIPDTLLYRIHKKGNDVNGCCWNDADFDCPCQFLVGQGDDILDFRDTVQDFMSSFEYLHTFLRQAKNFSFPVNNNNAKFFLHHTYGAREGWLRDVSWQLPPSKIF